MRFIILVAFKAEWPDRYLDVPIYDCMDIKALSSKDSIIVLVTGLGSENARRAAEYIATHFQAFFVLNIGTCGNPKRTFPLYEPVLISRIFSGCNSILLGAPLPLVSDPLLSGTLETLDRPFRDSNCDCTDMEGFALASIFHSHVIPFYCLKVISDHDECSLSEFKQRLPRIHATIRHVFRFLCFSTHPTVSVIIPTHNRSHTLIRALDSVFDQSRTPNQVMVVDDASEDDTTSALMPYRDRISYTRFPYRKGVSAARNHGLQSVETDWVCYLDSDDVWEPEKIQHQLSYLRQNPFFGILQSEETWIRNGHLLNQKKYHQKMEGWQYLSSLERCMISPSSVMMHISLARNTLFDPFLPVCEDYDAWLSITRRFPVGLSPTVDLIKYGGHSDQLSHHYPAMDHFRVLVLLKHLASEQDPFFRSLLEDMIHKKAHILLSGAQKRGYFMRARFYERVLQDLSTASKAEITASTPILPFASQKRSLGA